MGAIVSPPVRLDKPTVSFVPSASGRGHYTGVMKGLREFIDWLREALKGAPQPQPVPVPVRVRDRR
ncbi:hypothetical protein DAERI_090090 [Deinococcus aerius]|uniref:Uncharacterized protein n=1 Tax=Deinococcus aerius TaxID=200253 RepID=A0A2I9CWU1_9DEIO|nr:hypothetical protein DAERI_090090 [Deinococcus aerius]